MLIWQLIQKMKSSSSQTKSRNHFVDFYRKKYRFIYIFFYFFWNKKKTYTWKFFQTFQTFFSSSISMVWTIDLKLTICFCVCCGLNHHGRDGPHGPDPGGQGQNCLNGARIRIPRDLIRYLNGDDLIPNFGHCAWGTFGIRWFGISLVLQ